MFNSITGTITEKDAQVLCVETAGIEWKFSVSDATLSRLPSVGSEAKIFVHLVHTEDAMTLYGFASKDERALFFDLLKVDGIGPKAAIKILSHISVSNLADALEKGDVAPLEKVPGIGKKTAAKMLLALKGKLTLPSDEKIVRVQRTGEFDAVVSSLSSMGYDRKRAEQTVLRLAQNLSDDKDFQQKKMSEKEDALFRLSLVEMAQ